MRPQLASPTLSLSTKTASRCFLSFWSTCYCLSTVRTLVHCLLPSSPDRSTVNPHTCRGAVPFLHGLISCIVASCARSYDVRC